MSAAPALAGLSAVSVALPARPGSSPWLRLVGLLVGAAILAWSFSGTSFSLAELLAGWPAVADLVSKMLPPSQSVIPRLWGPLFTTVQMAIVGTAVAACAAVPLGILGASNVTPHLGMRRVVRFVLNGLRTIPELVYALLFVAAVGLGPFAGVMALLLHSAGFLGKVYSEALESVDPKPSEALRGMGVSGPQAAWYAVVPQALPIMASYVLYNLEVNFRAATVLGLVGGGGIGFELQVALSLFHLHDVATIVIFIGAGVVVLDAISSLLRRRLA